MDVPVTLKRATWELLNEAGILDERTAGIVSGSSDGKFITECVPVPMMLGAIYTLISRLEKADMHKTAQLIEQQVSR